MNQNMELDFGYKVIIQMYSFFLALSEQSLEHYHALYMVEYLAYAFSIVYSTAAQKRRSSGVRQIWVCNGFFSKRRNEQNLPC